MTKKWLKLTVEMVYEAVDTYYDENAEPTDDINKMAEIDTQELTGHKDTIIGLLEEGDITAKVVPAEEPIEPTKDRHNVLVKSKVNSFKAK
jgi:hypothetical protein